jgi:hypothetical protein
MGEIAKLVQENDKIQYEISALSIRYKTGESQKSTDLNLISRSFFMKIRMKTVINRDFLFCNRFILTNRYDSEIIDFRHNLKFSPVSLRNTQFHVVFPKHNLNFPPVSLRNTQFHVITMCKTYTQNGTMGLKRFETKQLYLIYLKIAPLVFCIRKYHIVSFRYCQFCTGSTGMSNSILI